MRSEPRATPVPTFGVPDTCGTFLLRILSCYAFPITDAVVTSFAIPDGEPKIDDTNGKLRAFAVPWATLDTPVVDANGAVVETGVTYPVSLRVSTKPDVVFTIASSAYAKGGK